MPKDFGYFGKGITGYAHYMQAFNRNSRGDKPPGAKGGCLTMFALLAIGTFILSVLVL